MILKLGSKGQEVGEWQTSLNALGSNLNVDNDFGSKTDVATRSFQKAHGLLVDGEVGDMSRATAAKLLTERSRIEPAHAFIEALIAVAASQIGVKEESRNRGAGIEKYWLATDYPNGMQNREPWCAAYQCWNVLQAMPFSKVLTEANRPKSASVEEWIKWVRENPSVAQLLSPSFHIPKRGDIAILSAVSHIVLIENYDSRRSPSITDLEGNTDENGGREGFEVARRQRKASAMRALIRFL